MANSNFVVQNGLTVGNLIIDASTGSITTNGSITVSAPGTINVPSLGVSAIAKNDTSISITDEGTGSNVRIIIDGSTEHTITSNGVELASGNWYAINGASVLSANTLGTGVVNSSLTSVGTLTGLIVSGTTNLSTTTASQVNSTSGNITTLVAGNFSTANAQITGGAISGGTGHFTTLQGTNFSSGNVRITGGYISSLTNATIITASVGTGTVATLNSTAGNVTTLVAGNFSTANAVISGGSVNNTTIGATTPNTGRFTTVIATTLNAGTVGNIGANIVGTGTYLTSLDADNLDSGTVPSARISGSYTGITALGTVNITNFSTANSQISGGAITATPVSGSTGHFTTLQGANFSTGNAVISGGYISSLANATITTTNTTTLNASTSTLTTLNSTAGNVTTLVAGNFSTANAQISGGAITATPVSGSTGHFTTLQGTNFSTANAQISGGAISGGTGHFTTLQGTNFSSGNARITGGAISGGTGHFTTLQGTNFSTANAQISGGAITATPISGSTGHFTTLQGTNFSTANAQITGGAISGGTGHFTTLQGTNFSTGNAVISGGYISTLANATVTALNSTYSATSNFSTANAVITGGSVNGTPIGATTASTGRFTTLNTTGNAVIGQNLRVDGDLDVAGTLTTFNSNTLIIEDSIIYLADNNTSDVLDAGLVSSFTNAFYQHTGFVRDATDGVWKLFANVTTEPSTTVDFTNATYSSIRVGPLTASSATINGTIVASTLNAATIGNTNATLTGTIQTASQTNITGLGTITTGTWAATDVALAHGGTNASLTAVNGGIVYSTASAMAITSAGTSGQVLTSGGAGAPTWANQNTLAVDTANYASAANVAIYESVTASTTNANLSPMLSGITTGNTASFTAATLVHNPSTGFLYATRFNGSGAGLHSIPNSSLTNSSITVNGTAISLGGSGTITSNTTNSITFNNGGAGDASGTTFNGSAARTISYNSVGAPSTTGTNASGTWAINISGTAAVATNPTFSGDSGDKADITTRTDSGFWQSDTATTAEGWPLNTGSWQHLISCTHANDANYYAMQLSADFYTQNLYYRSTNGSGSTAWSKVALEATSPTFTGITVPSITKSGTTGTGDIGSSGNTFNTVYAKATSAQYADLAENYLADASYEPGTVVMFGGDKEVTIADSDTRRVAGVVSTNPAHLMNSALTGDTVVALALQGRVPCRVVGRIQKGDMLISAGSGLAKASDDPRLGQVIGKALENYDSDVPGVIEVVVGRI